MDAQTGRKCRRADMGMITARGAEPGEWRQPWPTPNTPEMLGAWLHKELGLRPALHPIVEGHRAPMEYLVHTFFEGGYERGDGPGGWARVPRRRRTADCVVWANRGGGKTFLGAVATLLDVLFKPAVEVRVLAGSLEQSGRMHEYLRSLLGSPGIAGAVKGRITTRAVRIGNGSCAQVLAASQTSVRGTRVQKIRCDEVDLFDPELWRAAQLVTRSLAPCRGPWGSRVRGSVEALSTMHRPHGLMWDLINPARERAAGMVRAPVFRWGVVDVLERCGPARACAGCVLLDECRGRAKRVRGGHVKIDDAVALKGRVDLATWESEMLCLRPRRTHAVYPGFDPAVHVLRAGDPRTDAHGPVRRGVAWHAAMDFGIRGESVVLLASVDEAGIIVVERERCGPDLPLGEQMATLRGWIAAGACPGGLAAVSIDPAGFNRSDQTSASNASLLRHAGWTVRGARASIQTGLRLVRARLAPADGSPARLFVHERCARLVECLQRYHYPENKAESSEPVKDGFDHACDALRYLVASLDGGEGVNVKEY